MVTVSFYTAPYTTHDGALAGHEDSKRRCIIYTCEDCGYRAAGWRTWAEHLLVTMEMHLRSEHGVEMY